MPVFFRGPLKILSLVSILPETRSIYIFGAKYSLSTYITFAFVPTEEIEKSASWSIQRIEVRRKEHYRKGFPHPFTAVHLSFIIRRKPLHFVVFFHGALHADRSTDFCQLLYSCREWGANRFQLYNPSLCERLPSDRDRGPPRTVRLSATNWCILHHNHDRNSVGADRHHCGTQGTSRYYPATWLSQGYVVYQ